MGEDKGPVGYLVVPTGGVVMDSIIPIQSRGELFMVVVDEEDYDRLSKFRWSIGKCSGPDRNPKYYVRRHVCRQGKQVTVYMHREVLGVLPGVVVDHLDGNGLNNTKRNLRATTVYENARRQIHAYNRRTQ